MAVDLDRESGGLVGVTGVLSRHCGDVFECRGRLFQGGRLTDRALLANAVTGVTDGFKKELDIVGIGYRAEVKGTQVVFALGYSHPIVLDIPPAIDITIDKQTHVTVSGIDKQLVGQVAAEVRAYRPPEPYKGKGVRHRDEVIVLKETKKK